MIHSDLSVPMFLPVSSTLEKQKIRTWLNLNNVYYIQDTGGRINIHFQSGRMLSFSGEERDLILKALESISPFQQTAINE